MTKEEIIEDIYNIINNADGMQHCSLHLAAERIFHKYVAVPIDMGTGEPTYKMKESKKINLMVHKCPICEGRTVVPAGFYTPIGYNFSGTSAAPETCKACNGTGIIKT